MIQFSTKQVPLYVRSVAQILISAGFEAHLVGGAVRDLLVGRKVKDFDIATDALPIDVQKLFPKAILTGERFGNTIVISQDEFGEPYDVDVTTYRKEEDYFGGRWPGKVEFTSKIEEDLSRRDFTINAIALNVKKILEVEDQQIDLQDLIDPFFGISDLLSGTIRAVRDPVERMSEDGLRAFRACRLACELSFTIEESTQRAIEQTLHVAERISMERIRDGINKMILHAKKPSIGFIYMDKLGLLKQIIPELSELKNVLQPEWHTDDVFTHSLKTLDLAEDSIKLAALFHDLGKARTISVDEKGTHFYAHDVIGAEMTREIMRRLRYSNKEIDRIANLVRWHMFYYPSADWRKNNNIVNILDVETNNDHGWSDSAIRRFIRNVGGLDQVDDLIKLRIADAGSNPKSIFNPIELEVLQKRISEVVSNDMALKISDLAVDGQTLMELGLPEGPLYGKILNYLLDQVIENPSINKKEKLIELILIKFNNQKE